MDKEALPELSEDLTKLLDKIILNQVNRNEAFYKLGQEYLLSLRKRELFLEVVSIFDYFLKNKDKWIGKDFIVPEIYRTNRHTTQEVVFRDITYYIREAFMWSTLYNQHDYINFNEEGVAFLNKKPEIRITEMNMEKKYTKNEHGGLIATNVKPDLNKKLPSGFTVEQSHEVINAALVGYMPEVQAYETKNERKNKKKPLKEVEDNYTEEDFIKENTEVAEKKEKANKTTKKTSKKKM